MGHYETEEYRGFTINIDYDTDCESPREWDNIAHIICWHRDYNIGDKHDYNDESSLFKDLAKQYVTGKAVKDFITEHKGDCWLEKQAECYILHDGETDYYDAQYELDVDLDIIVEQAFDYLSDQDRYALIETSGKLVIAPVSYYDHSGISVWIGSPNDKWDSGRCGWIYQTKRETIKEQGATEENWRDVAWKNMEAEMKVYGDYVSEQCFGYTVEDESGDCVDNCWGYIGINEIEEIKSQARATIDAIVEQEKEERNNLIEFTIANQEHLPEGRLLVDGDVVYRIDRHNLFKTPQFTLAPIKNSVVGVFDTVEISSVPTEMLERIKSLIENHQTISV